MSDPKVLIFGSFTEDETSSFQKASVQESKTIIFPNELQFGSFKVPVKTSHGDNSIRLKNVNNEEMKNINVDKTRQNATADKPMTEVELQSLDTSQSKVESCKTLDSSQSKVESCKTVEENFAGDTAMLVKQCVMKHSISASMPIPETLPKKSENNTPSIKTELVNKVESADRSNDSFVSMSDNNTMDQQLQSLALSNGDVQETVDDPNSLSNSIPLSWAAKLAGKMSNGSQKPNRLSYSTVAKVNLNDNSAGSVVGTKTAIKKFCPRGLINPGNLCFLNATLQALLACLPFFQLLQSLKSRSLPEVGFPTLRAFVDFVANFEDDEAADSQSKKSTEPPEGVGIGHPFSPSMFDSIVKKFSPQQPVHGHGRTRQEDAQEFLSFIMDQMHRELLKLEKEDPSSASHNHDISLVTASGDDDWETVGPKNQTAVTRTQSFLESDLTRIFGGTLRSVVKSRGNKPSATIQPFLLLHLDIISESISTVEDALRHYVSTESLEDYRVSTGKAGIVSARKSVKLMSLPKVLVLHLARFSYGNTGSNKVHKPVHFSSEVTLSRDLLVSPTTEGRRYGLVATVTHHGRDPSKGHYTADTKISDGQWLHFDDSSVSVVGMKKVLHNQAYLLFYIQI